MTAGFTTKASGERTRTEIASGVIKASPPVLYRALLDPEAVAFWQPPKGMICRIYAFDTREGGIFRMSLAYADAGHRVRGKASEHVDTVRGHFVELVGDERVVQRVQF
jgi:uncharacterized protein YndB with AHSA1/START domain